MVGIVTAFEMFGAAVGAVASGMLFDAYLSFTPAWIMVMGATLVMGAALLWSIRASRKLVERATAEGAPLLVEGEGRD